MNDPARCIPILASLDLEETMRFYTEQLGFAGESWGDYAILRREAMELHFCLTTDRLHPEHTSCYIRGGQVPLCMRNSRRAAWLASPPSPSVPGT